MQESAMVEEGGGAARAVATQDAHLVGSLLDGFLERAVERFCFGQAVQELLENQEHAALVALANEAVDLLVAEEDDLEELEGLLRSLERARRQPALREFVLPGWSTYFRPSVGPLRLRDEMLEKFKDRLHAAPDAESAREARRKINVDAIFLASFTSLLKTKLEIIFRQDPLLSWMSRW